MSLRCSTAYSYNVTRNEPMLFHCIQLQRNLKWAYVVPLHTVTTKPEMSLCCSTAYSYNVTWNEPMFFHCTQLQRNPKWAYVVPLHAVTTKPEMSLCCSTAYSQNANPKNVFSWNLLFNSKNVSMQVKTILKKILAIFTNSTLAILIIWMFFRNWANR